MGEVYLAEDTTLGRKVALKFLPPGLVKDDDRLRRFTQEAKAASALNHPNILTIHEIGRTGETSFLATEFIDGRTLRQRLSTGPMPPRQAIDVGLQIAAGLTAAHTAGIIHRDVKPENIMVRSDGYVKILDFGLAKLVGPDSDGSDAATELAVRTGAGVVMGTARYMSPEQARGLALDARSDIFSLGAVLYEALAGRPAFDGATASHVIVSVIEKDPPSLSSLAADIPAELERIVSKALAKDPDERFQSVRDLAVDLKRLKQRLEVDAELSRSTPGHGQAPAAPRRRSGAVAWMAGAAVLVAVVALAWFRSQTAQSPGSPAASSSASTMTLTRLTSTGTATTAAISPDGRYVVHAGGLLGQQGLWIRQTATTSNVQITPPSAATYTALAFSPDGNFLFYAKSDSGKPPVLYEMPVLGGTSKQISAGLSSGAELSPDGARIVFTRRDSRTDNVSKLIVVGRDGTGEREIAGVGLPGFFYRPSWSPDGTLVAVTEQRFAPTYHGMLIVVPADGGEKRVVGSREWFAVRGAHWLSPDRIAVVASEPEAGLDGYQIWSVTYPGGEVTKITNDLNNYAGLSVTADGRSLVTTQTTVNAALWVLPAGDTNARQVMTGLGQVDGVRGLTWTPDERLVFTSRVGDRDGLYIADADGRNPTLVVSGTTLHHPSVCGAGGTIVYTGNVGQGPRFFRVGVNGQDGRQVLQSEAGEQGATCLPDGQWVVYRSEHDGQLWRSSIDGSNPTRLTDIPNGRAYLPALSPDGRSIAYVSSAPTSQLAIISSEGGAATRRFDFPASADWNTLQWTADGAAVSYINSSSGVETIWIQPVAGGPPRQVTGLSSSAIFNHAWSRTGQLLLSRGTQSRDVVLIKDW